MSPPSPPAGTDIIRIKGLTLPFFIGVHEFEKAERQTVVIDVDLVVASAVRHSGEYVSYSDVTQYAISLSRRSEHIALVETLAQMILEKSFEDDRVERARVSVMKSDIYPEAAGVGIIIESARGDLSQ
ncbi:MAG: dihydroneopterin aldolase [Pseudomonadota bacterium]